MTTVVVPKLDDNGAGYVITISQTLLFPRNLNTTLLKALNMAVPSQKYVLNLAISCPVRDRP